MGLFLYGLLYFLWVGRGLKGEEFEPWRWDKDLNLGDGQESVTDLSRGCFRLLSRKGTIFSFDFVFLETFTLFSTRNLFYMRHLIWELKALQKIEPVAFQVQEENLSAESAHWWVIKALTNEAVSE